MNFAHFNEKNINLSQLQKIKGLKNIYFGLLFTDHDNQMKDALGKCESREG